MLPTKHLVVNMASWGQHWWIMCIYTSLLWPRQSRTRFRHCPTFTHTPLLDNPESGPLVKALGTVNNPVYLEDIKRMLHSKMSKPTGAQLGEGRTVKELWMITSPIPLASTCLITPIGSLNAQTKWPLALLFHSWESHSLEPAGHHQIRLNNSSLMKCYSWPLTSGTGRNHTYIWT